MTNNSNESNKNADSASNKNMNTQNNEWRDLLPDEKAQNGDRKVFADGTYVIKHDLTATLTRLNGKWQTRRPLPTATGAENATVDPIAAAITQMEEAARVLRRLDGITSIELSWGNDGATPFWQVSDEGVLNGRVSLAEALGYTSPDQQHEEKIREADAKMQKAKDLFDKANEIEAQAAVLIEEAKKLRQEAGV